MLTEESIQKGYSGTSTLTKLSDERPIKLQRED